MLSADDNILITFCISGIIDEMLLHTSPAIFLSIGVVRLRAIRSKFSEPRFDGEYVTLVSVLCLTPTAICTATKIPWHFAFSTPEQQIHADRLYDVYSTLATCLLPVSVGVYIYSAVYRRIKQCVFSELLQEEQLNTVKTGMQRSVLFATVTTACTWAVYMLANFLYHLSGNWQRYSYLAYIKVLVIFTNPLCEGICVSNKRRNLLSLYRRYFRGNAVHDIAYNIESGYLPTVQRRMTLQQNTLPYISEESTLGSASSITDAAEKSKVKAIQKTQCDPNNTIPALKQRLSIDKLCQRSTTEVYPYIRRNALPVVEHHTINVRHKSEGNCIRGRRFCPWEDELRRSNSLPVGRCVLNRDTFSPCSKASGLVDNPQDRKLSQGFDTRSISCHSQEEMMSETEYMELHGKRNSFMRYSTDFIVPSCIEEEEDDLSISCTSKGQHQLARFQTMSRSGTSCSENKRQIQKRCSTNSVDSRSVYNLANSHRMRRNSSYMYTQNKDVQLKSSSSQTSLGLAPSLHSRRTSRVSLRSRSWSAASFYSSRQSITSWISNDVDCTRRQRVASLNALSGLF